MDDDTLNQAIELSKVGRKMDARKLLRPLLEVEPENEMAWLWFANSFDALEERLKALKNCLLYCPDSQLAADGVQALEEQLKTALPEIKVDHESLTDDLRNNGAAMFTELDADDVDNSPFADVSIGAGRSLPFDDRPDQVNFTGTTAPQVLVNNAQIGLGEHSGMMTPPKAGLNDQTVSPFTTAGLEDFNRESLQYQADLKVDQQNASGAAYRIPFIIVSITGSLLLIVFAIIMIILFLGR